jgi:hypothetical protein
MPPHPIHPNTHTHTHTATTATTVLTHLLPRGCSCISFVDLEDLTILESVRAVLGPNAATQ